MKSIWVDLGCQEIPAAAVLVVYFELVVREASGHSKGGDLAPSLPVEIVHTRRGQPTPILSLLDASLDRWWNEKAVDELKQRFVEIE